MFYSYLSVVVWCSLQGLAPEIVPSNFQEDLPLSSFEDIHEYPVATATHKAIEVYERLVVSPTSTETPRHLTYNLKEENPENPPDIVIAGDAVFDGYVWFLAWWYFELADTVVLTHAQPVTSDTSYSVLPQVNQELLEKPISKDDNLRMLLDLNGGVCEVVTGVVVGELF